MDETRFDRWTRRRFGLLGAAGLTAPTLGFALNSANARKKKKKKKKQADPCAADPSCADATCCPAGYPAQCCAAGTTCCTTRRGGCC